MPRRARIVAGVVVEFAQAVQGFTLPECYPAAFLAECSPAPDDVQPGWTATQDADGAWSFSAPAPRVVAPVAPVVTSLGFLDLFTADEQAAVFAAAPRSPALLGLLFQVACAGSVHLDDPRVIAGLGLLHSGGLVAPKRAAQVLARTFADGVSFDAASATDAGPARPDAVAFDLDRATET